MDHQIVTVRTSDRIMVVSIDRELRSETDLAVLASELSQCCSEAASSGEVRVLLLTGNHDQSFSPDVFPDRQTLTISLAAPVAALNLPVIAAIKGDALDQGLELTLACDIRIACETGRFGLTQIRTGQIPGDGGTQRLARLVGKARAAEMIFTGETIDAAEALRVGMVHRVVAGADLMPAALQMARDMAAKSPLALRAVKEAVYKGMDMTLEQGLRLEADLYFLLHTTADRTEGITSFREKRTPDFKGR